MATKIIHKKSSVASSVPSAGDLEPGEIAVNLADQKIYSKTTGGTVIELAPAGAASNSLTENCKNVSGGSLAIGTPVYQSGTAGNAMEVQKALSGTAASMPAVGLLSSTLADEAEGTIVLSGFLQGLNTSTFSEGDTLYVSATGTLTTTIPAGEANLIQNIGKVIKVHASNGSVMVTGAGRANATPNLDTGNIFIGSGSNQSSTVSFNDTVDAHLNQSTASANEVLSWDGSDYNWTAIANNLQAYTATEFTATASQTTFTVDYTAGEVDIYLNGVKLVNSDYTATNGTTIVLTTAAAANDILNVVAWNSFTPADTATSAQGALADSALQKAGGTMTGVIAGFESTGIDDNATSTAMTLDGSGNLLVGKTSDNNALEGVTLVNSGTVKATTNNDLAGIFNRTGTDDDIVQFWKDGVPVGSIGSYAGDMVTGTGDVGLRWEDAGDLLTPWNPSTNLPRASAIDLGASSVPFKDLYLSGGVYLGGTGSANKLDDYEEGTWTPTVSTGSLSATGTYVKVGKLVSVFLNGQVTTGGATQISGLPFNTAGNYGFSPYVSTQDIPSGQNSITFVTNGSTLLVRAIGDNTTFSTTALTTGAYIHASFVYETA
jgi:hypothetical protein